MVAKTHLTGLKSVDLFTHTLDRWSQGLSKEFGAEVVDEIERGIVYLKEIALILKQAHQKLDKMTSDLDHSTWQVAHDLWQQARISLNNVMVKNQLLKPTDTSNEVYLHHSLFDHLESLEILHQHLGARLTRPS